MPIYAQSKSWDAALGKYTDPITWSTPTPTTIPKNVSDALTLTVTEAPINARIIRISEALTFTLTDATPQKQVSQFVKHVSDALTLTITESTPRIVGQVIQKSVADFLTFLLDDTVRGANLVVHHVTDDLTFTLVEAAAVNTTPGGLLTQADIEAIKNAIWRGVEVEVGTGITPLLALQLKAAVEGGQGANLGRANLPQTFYGAGRGLTVTRVVSTVDPVTGQRVVTLTLSET